MPIASRTIQNSIDWAKRMMFNRNPVIGNSLEPALTSAAIVMQTILSPPFEWWWNGMELSFTCSPTPSSASSTAAVVSAGTITVTAVNSFAVGNQVTAAGYTGALAGINGQIVTIATASGSQFTAPVINIANVSDTTGTWTNVTSQDYALAVPSFSHIEHASVLDLSGTSAPYTPAKWMELTVKTELALETSSNRPMFISPHIEDASGNMSFRVFPSPDKPYPVSLHVQLAAPTLATGVNSTWAPIPDFMQYIYDAGFLSLMLQFSDDSRFAYWENKFKAALLSRADGLTEEDQNIFLNNWEDLKSGYGMRKQQGVGARGQ